MRAFSTFLLVAALTGCASGPRVLVEPLAVYAAPDEVGFDYAEIALLSVTSGERPLQAGTAQERNLEALVEEAKTLGADALIVTDGYDPTQPTSGSGDPQRADRVDQTEQTGRLKVSRAVWTTKATAVVYR